MALADQVYGFYIPNVSLMGVGASKEAGAQAKALGATKALIVTDKVLNKLGVAARIQGQLAEAGVKAFVFDGAEPNPTDTNVADGLKAYRAERVRRHRLARRRQRPRLRARASGWSPRTAATSAATKASTQTTKPMPPFVAINTTAGTGERDDPLLHHHEHQHAREDGDRGLALHAQRRDQRPGADGRECPRRSPPRPAWTPSRTPSRRTSRHRRDPITDACALKAIALIAEHLRPAGRERREPRRARPAWPTRSTSPAWRSTTRASGTSTRWPTSSAASTTCRTACATRSSCRRSASSTSSPAPRGSATSPWRSARASTGSRRWTRRRRASRRSASCRGRFGIPAGLKELGVKEADLPTMAENAKKDACQLTNPRTATLQQVVEIFKAAM